MRTNHGTATRLPHDKTLPHEIRVTIDRTSGPSMTVNQAATLVDAMGTGATMAYHRGSLPNDRDEHPAVDDLAVFMWKCSTSRDYAAGKRRTTTTGLNLPKPMGELKQHRIGDMDYLYVFERH